MGQVSVGVMFLFYFKERLFHGHGHLIFEDYGNFQDVPDPGLVLLIPGLPDNPAEWKAFLGD